MKDTARSVYCPVSLAIASAVRVLILEDIPTLSSANYNEAKRFVLLIDTLYDAGVRLVASSAKAPERIYDGKDHRLEFARTVSRLVEMRSQDYLALPHGRRDSRASGDTTGLVET